MLQKYQEFRRLLPDICADAKLTVDELIFDDFVTFATGYIAQLRVTPSIAIKGALHMA